MPASVIINRVSGDVGSPTYTNFTNARTRAAISDTPHPGIGTPLNVPNPGQVSRSYWLTLQLQTLLAPDTLLNNVRISTDGANAWPGVEAKIALASAYVEATGIEGVQGDELNITNHPSLLFTPVPLQNYTSSTPLVMSASTTTAEKFGEFIVIQLTGTNRAISGTLPPEFLQFTWDET